MLGGLREPAGGLDLPAAAGSVYIVVDDPDALYQRAREAGATVVREIRDEDYGSREFSVRDPEGVFWSFGTWPGADHAAQARDADAADRFRAAVAQRDVDAMLATFAPEAELNSPTMPQPVVGLDRLRAVFVVLADIFEDFEYTRFLEGTEACPSPGVASVRALMFRCRVSGEEINGVDVIDIDGSDRIVRFTVLIRPLAGLRALGEAIVRRLGAAPAGSLRA
jgi:hypothetical protein